MRGCREVPDATLPHKSVAVAEKQIVDAQRAKNTVGEGEGEKERLEGDLGGLPESLFLRGGPGADPPSFQRLSSANDYPSHKVRPLILLKLKEKQERGK